MTARIVEILVGLLLLVGVATMLARSPAETRFELRALAAHQLVADLLLTIVVLAETYVGLRLVLSSSPLVCASGLCMLVVFSIHLVYLGLADGWSVQCGCLDLLVEQSASAGLIRNTALILMLSGAAFVRTGAWPPTRS